MNPFLIVRDSAFNGKVPCNELHASLHALLTLAAANYTSGWATPTNKYAYVLNYFENNLLSKEHPCLVTMKTLWGAKSK